MSLAAYQGEFVVFVGSSGCGSSTLLRLITGLSVLRAVSAHDRAGENGVRPEDDQDTCSRDRSEGDRSGRHPETRSIDGLPAPAALGRTAPARGHWPMQAASMRWHWTWRRWLAMPEYVENLGGTSQLYARSPDGNPITVIAPGRHVAARGGPVRLQFHQVICMPLTRQVGRCNENPMKRPSLQKFSPNRRRM